MRFLIAAFPLAQLRKESLALIHGIVQLGIAIGDFHPSDIQLEALNQTRVACFSF